MTFTSEHHADVLIIGAGVVGLALARELKRRGAGRVTLLERGTAGAEASHAAAGMLAPHAETDRLDDFFSLCADALGVYPSFAEALLDETGVDVELDRSGTLYLALTEADAVELRHRYEWQRAAGLEIAHLSARETRRIEPFVSPDVRESLFFPNDWQVENRRLVHALARSCALAGVTLRENAEVAEIVVERGRAVGARAAGGARFAADWVVAATGAWTSLIKAGSAPMPEVRPIRGQMIAFHTARRLFEKVIYSPRGYLVPRADGRVLIGATVEDAGFDKSVTPAGVEYLRENALEIAPSLVNLEIAETWAGLRPFAAGGRPLLGTFPQVENLLLATAHYRNGILLAPLTARLLADRIVDGRTAGYLETFAPGAARPTAGGR